MGNGRKHILITLPSLEDPGGVAGYYNAILPHLPDKKLTVSTLEIGSTKGGGQRLYLLTDQLRFHYATKKHRPHLVHVNPSLDIKSFIRDGLFIFQAKRKKLPVIVFFRGWQKNFERVVQSRLRFFFNCTYARADSFIVLANEFKTTLQRWGITQPIHLGTTTVDESLLKNFSFSNKLAKIKRAEQIKILFLSRLEREKGIFETIDAVSILIQKGFSVSLSIAGDGMMMDKLKHYVNKQKISKNSICFLGYLKKNEKSIVLADHHIYCLPTYYGEGLPNSILEAMAFGLPVVTRPVGGIADFFRSEKMGILCQGKTANEIAVSLEKIIENKEMMIQMSAYNFEYAKEHFMASSVAQKLSAIYQLNMV